MRPKSVNFAEMFGWVATGLGALSVFIMLIQALSARPGIGAGGILVLLFQLALFGALGLATFYLGKRRHEAGRWGFVVVGALLALQMTGRLNGLSMADGGLGILYIFLDMLALAAILAGIVALLQPDAHRWFAQGPMVAAPRPAAQAYPGYGAPQGGAAPYAGQQGYPPHDPNAAPGYPPQTAYPPATGAAPLGQAPQPGYHADGTPIAGYDPNANPPRL